MPQDIYNAAGDGAGNQRIGVVLIRASGDRTQELPGRYTNTSIHAPTSVDGTDVIASVSGKFVTRFDDASYY